MIADHCEVSQLISLALVNAAHGCLEYSADYLGQCAYRHSKTTTVSLLAGMKPSMKTFLLPQL